MNSHFPDEMITIASLEDLIAESIPIGAVKERLSLLFVIKGGGACLREGEFLPLEEGNIYTGVADCFRHFEIVEGAIGYLLTIDASKLAAEPVTIAYKAFFAVNQPRIPLEIDIAEEMHWLVRVIVKKMRSKEKYKNEIVQHYISLFMLHLRSAIKDELVVISMDRKGVLVKDFFALLEDGFMMARSVDYYADKLCVSPKHLTNVIKLESGYPTSYHINQRVVFEAKRIAQATGASLKQIAYELGYEDVAAFSKLFKRVTGENFSTYKGNLKFAFCKIGPSLRRGRGRGDNV